MSSNVTTSAVEDVGSGEQGNIQAQGESNLGMGQGTPKTKNNTHSSRVNTTNQITEERRAERQTRTGQWRARKAQDKKVRMFRSSAASDRLKTEPTHKDLMTVVNKENRFAKVKEKDTETDRMKREIMAHQGRQAVQDTPDQKSGSRVATGT